MHARRRLGECIRRPRCWCNTHAILAYLPLISPNAWAVIGRPPKAENGGPWTDGLIQDRDRLPISIEPDCLVRRIIDHKPNRFAKRGNPFWNAIEHLPHETHWPLS